MLRKLLEQLGLPRGDPPPALRGRPRVQREKTYSADSGYVYQYVYAGYRAASRAGEQGQEFVFDCTSDRSSRFQLSIFAPDASYAAWERDSGRELNEVERFAVAKMRLFKVFDESDRIGADCEARLTAEDVARQVAALDL